MTLFRRTVFLAAILWMSAAASQAQDRMPELAPGQLTDAQRLAAQIFRDTRGVPVFGPFVPLIRSPDLMLAAKNMGDYLRYHNTLPLALNEFAILITAREWTQQLEWQIHYPLALKAGLKPAIADAVALGRKPDGMSDEEDIVWQFSTELHQQKKVSDATYARALAKFGDKGVIDMAGTNGYYDFLAQVMNATQTAPDPKLPLLPVLQR